MYSSSLVKKLNSDIISHFSNIKPIEDSFKNSFSGVSRLVMLDRYSQKDKNLISIGLGDLVITVIKDDSFFPVRGIGYIQKIDASSSVVEIKIEEEFLSSIDSNKLLKNTNNVITKNMSEIEKPLEIYYEQIAWRVSNNLANQEMSSENKKEWQKIFFKELSEFKIIPAGRVLYGAGSYSNVTLFNCFVMPMIKDSREGISHHRKEVMEIMSRGGGVGTNGSTLRPRGMIAKSVGGRSSGSVSWLNDLSILTHLVEQGGSRRGAQMIMMADWHPDIVEFIISKMQNPKILSWLLNHMNNQKIKDEVLKKIHFKPLSKEDSEMYEGILKNESSFNSKIVEDAREKIFKNGKWEVNNKSFLSGANISIAISHKFMKAIEDDKVWELKYPDLASYNKKEKQFYDENWHLIGDIFEWERLGYKTKVFYKIRARELWDLINFCANYSAEPGIFFIDTANDLTNASSYGMKVVATNPCGEQPLAPYSVCNLAAINLSKFVNKNTKEILYKELEKTVMTSVRLQDNVIDSTPYFLEANKKQALGERRLGLGVMGLHDMLIWAGYRYGSKEANQIVDKVFQVISETAYSASSDLAKEKGSFPFLKDNKKFIETGYMKKMKESIRTKILEQGIRNSHLLTIAPTGSTGTMMGVSTGLEPYFAFKFYRSGRLGKFIEVTAEIVEDWLKINPGYNKDNLPDIFVSSMDLKPEEHVDVQCIIQKWIDSSISKTVNAPRGYSVKQVEKIYSKLYKGGAKGGTVYVDGSRDAQVLSLSNNEESTEQLKIDKFVDTDSLEIIDNSVPDKIKDSVELRGIKQDRAIGIKIGDLCPICLEGSIIQAGGCATCSNCSAQLKCEV